MALEGGEIWVVDVLKRALGCEGFGLLIREAVWQRANLRRLIYLDRNDGFQKSKELMNQA